MKYLIFFIIAILPMKLFAEPPDSISLVFDGIGHEQPLAWPNAKHITNVIVGSYYYPVIIWETGSSWDGQLLFSYWDDQFKFWSYPDSFTQNQGMDTGRGNVATDSHGNLHFAWHQTGNSDGYETYYTSALLDTTAGILQYYVQNPIMVSSTDGYEDAYPALCIHNDSIYMVWNHGVIGQESAIFSNTPAETAYAGPISGGFLLNSIAPDPLTGDLWVASTFDINGDSLIDIVALHYDQSSGTWSNEVAAYGINSHDFICGGITVNYDGVPGIVFLSISSSKKERFIVDPYGVLLFSRKFGGSWTTPDTIEPTVSTVLNGTIGWPSVGIAENNDIYITFTQPISEKNMNRYGIGPVYYTKIVPDSNIYDLERVLVSSDSVACYHPHIVYNIPLSITPPGPCICWCQKNGGIVSIYVRHMPPLSVDVQEKRRKTPILALTIKPNPFTTSTTIILPNTGHRAKSMEVHIFDVTGRRVREFILYPSSFILGATWDGRDEAGKVLPPGIYFLKLNGKPVGKVVKVR